MHCQDVMVRDVQACAPDTTARAAAAIMREYDIGFLPVVDQERNVVGVVTDRDLAIRALAQGDPELRVDAFMSRRVIACHPEDDLSMAGRLMAQHKKGRIVCVDPNGRLAGVISITDLAEVEGEDTLVRIFRAIANRETWFLML